MMQMKDHQRRLELITKKYSLGGISGMTEMREIVPLPPKEEEELADLETLIRLQGKVWR